MPSKPHRRRYCSCERKRKSRAYGQKRGRYWCDYCDANLVTPINKGSERQKAKRLIKKAVNES